MPETASPGTPSARTVRLASALAAKIRRGERTATSRWRQVPRRSSLANTSPATTEVSSGKNQLPANDSTTSAPAQPVACISRPNRVSAGRVPCPLTTATVFARPHQTRAEGFRAPPLGQLLDQLEAVRAGHRDGAGRQQCAGGG